MNGMTDPCAAFRDALMDYADGSLEPAARDAARAHERACAACASLTRSVREQAAIFSRLPRPAPPPDLGARIERALGTRGTVRSVARRRPWIAAAAAVLVAAAAFFAAPRSAAPERSVRIVDVELPDRGSFLGHVTPTAGDPGASLLDPLVSNENP